MLAAPAGIYAQVNVLTNRYDNARTGANLNETNHDNAVVVYGLLPQPAFQRSRRSDSCDRGGQCFFRPCSSTMSDRVPGGKT